MVQSIAIIGAGNMGSGIAQKSATEGFSVQMVDREQQWVDRGHATIDKFLQEALEISQHHHANRDPEVHSREGFGVWKGV